MKRIAAASGRLVSTLAAHSPEGHGTRHLAATHLALSCFGNSLDHQCLQPDE